MTRDLFERGSLRERVIEMLNDVDEEESGGDKIAAAQRHVERIVDAALTEAAKEWEESVWVTENMALKRELAKRGRL